MSRSIDSDSASLTYSDIQTLTCIICLKNFHSSNEHKCQYNSVSQEKNSYNTHQVIIISNK